MAAVLLMMSFFQTHMLFPTEAVPAAGPMPAGAEKLEIEASGGVRLHGVHFRPRSEGDNPLFSASAEMRGTVSMSRWS